MFESLGHPERIKAMREFLPNAWGYFNMILDDVLLMSKKTYQLDEIYNSEKGK